MPGRAMTQFEELKKEVKSVGFETARSEEQHYFEAVILKGKLKELTLSLERFFGGAQKEVSVQAREAVSSFGGIIAGQTLYYSAEGSSFIFAMLWPWQDGEHITLKMACG